MKTSAYLEKMRREWNVRARENAAHYIANGVEQWDQREFYESGKLTVEQDILTDMWHVCQSREPKDMRVLEVGCGAGRVSWALGTVFGEVHSVDVSEEMIHRARANSPCGPNVFFHRNNGMDLSVLPEAPFHFAYSTCVFHHIASREVIESYVREVHRSLLPGCLFKFEVQGCLRVNSPADDTWLGLPFSETDAHEMAARCGFECRFAVGAGEERFWLWFFKPASS
ncbi:MAG: class I SAM-dependent methyltransferase [Bryobacteraceae bacterium]